MCPSTRLVPHRLPADRTYSKFPANRHSWYVHAGHHIVHELGLTLVRPAHPEAPSTVSPAPPSLYIPRAEQRPLTIRPPSPARAGVRAARLAAALAAGSSHIFPIPQATVGRLGLETS